MLAVACSAAVRRRRGGRRPSRSRRRRARRSAPLGLRLAAGRPSGAPRLSPYLGFLAVTLAWLAAALAGAIPFLLTGAFESPLDAFFEAMSGFTTTGATLLEDFGQPDAVFWWRSLMQYLGGIGIVVLVVAIAPVTGTGLQRAFYAEVSGVTTDRLTPRIIDTAKILAGIYGGLTAPRSSPTWSPGWAPSTRSTTR